MQRLKSRESAILHAKKKPTAVLAFTLVHSRSVSRWPCPHGPTIDVVVRPHFNRLPANVRDISEYGVKLSCLIPIERGTPLLFRLEPYDRLVSAKVIFSTRTRDGWYVGCAFAEELTLDEVVAYVTPGADPGA